MNKRISTLFATSLLFSSVFGSAWADDLKIGKLAEKLEPGKYYHLVMNGLSGDEGQYAYGFESYSKQNKTIEEGWANAGSDKSTDVNADNYLWKVTQVSLKSTTGKDEWAYVFQNVATGQYLRFYNGNVVLTTDGNNAAYKASTDQVSWGTDLWKYDTSVNSGTNDSKFNNERRLFITADLKDATQDPKIGLVLNSNRENSILGRAEAVTSAGVFNLYEAADESVTDTDLNKLYNSVGFNFSLGEDYEDVANIFDVDGQKVLAIQVKYNVYPKNEWNNGQGGDNYFPAGTYFAVKTPGKTPEQNTNSKEVNAAMYDFLMDCEFIAVNPNDNKSDKADIRKNGEGFALTTISARSEKFNMFAQEDLDIIDDNQDKLPSREEISVWNACFDVMKNASNADMYAIRAKKIYINETSDATVQKDKGAFDLDIASGAGYGASEYLVTYNGNSGYDYIFKFVESNAVDGTEFLYTDKAAIYNIKFVSGESDDHESEYGKYLFAPAYDDVMYAKGSVLTDKNLPEFQFVITEVKGKDVTFANRANDDVKFTAQLFDEGNGVYSLGVKDADDEIFKVLDVKNNGNVEIVKENNSTEKEFDLHLSHIVLETPESTDKFNGTWNVEDETKVTLAFARDNTPTSNKVYPKVKYSGSNFVFDNNTPEVAEAAQWQLNKSEKPSYITRTYAFRVGEGDKATVDYQIDGDSIAYYTYDMQLVKDGDLVNSTYLNFTGPSSVVGTLGVEKEFVIKNNLDGSVALIPQPTTGSVYERGDQVVITGYNAGLDVVSDLTKFLDKKITVDELSQESEAHFLNTYLLLEAPEKSWEEAGHVTIQSQKGDYVNMDEDRDGILVDNEAETLYLHMTDEKAVVPSFYISKAIKEGGNGLSERMYLFNPEDSIDYYVASGVYNKTYQWTKNYKKAIFKAGSLDASCDTMTTNIKGKVATVASKADNNGTQGGLDRFKFQIVETEEGDGTFYIRQKNANDKGIDAEAYDEYKNYLISYNEGLSWGSKEDALAFSVKGVEAPTSNERVSASEVKVIANNGSINVKNAAGKNVVVSTILGQVVANEVLTSDNATINVPAGIVVVAVEGESFKVNVK